MNRVGCRVLERGWVLVLGSGWVSPKRTTWPTTGSNEAPTCPCADSEHPTGAPTEPPGLLMYPRFMKKR